MYSSEAFLMHLYLILKISNYVEFASLLEIYNKKSAERPPSDVQTGAPRNENRFASPNRHRTKKMRMHFRGKGNTARDEPMLTYRSGGE
ncbi:hypothetical protein CEJ87_17255 [Caldifermentibacillus hisashii]|nr:hypothetical protein CEJ87_17255 [Caldifermentibacillus hisashii]